jgi:hypothetical protein
VVSSNQTRDSAARLRAWLWIATLAFACSACSDDREVVPKRDAASPRGGDDDDGGSDRAGCTACGGCPETQPVTGNTHLVGPISYPDPPPTSGVHDACWAKWGVHTEVVPARYWVHNLEHGGIVFLYNCPDGCDTDLERFTALAKANDHTLLTEYPELPTRFALVAWAHRLLSNCVDVPAFQAFYDANLNRGPEAIASNPGSSCPF